ncbi:MULTISPECIES: restriction endonuclease subunit S [unclassified Pseudoalteromonas]|uniref:restriction endonuclease subunit S n=1 Tax=unclassified Pseudoalteromonas TaxID=194690 RepID=UPI00110AB157|nr:MULTISPECIES: restriction endonuclease subunit S [unclassified Pseudoalteromonas]MDC9499227.1 restriction endonuclease subunit S [Pseudoalteromonas sp. Angola-20]MDC9518927.1 restriction endonuclease subunit S [Pseudoalteromonas sp. Angola-22]MDC9535328.1 restriction endonuclease subunit S [Pseudoalteromonas sp. Angola-9]TMP77630.1 restriction endonuclease subunit S [Pseudoalteromonas sp. S983]
MMPNGWEIKTLDAAKVVVTDGDRGKEYPKSSDFSEDGYCLFLSAKNVTKRGFSFSEKQFISKDKHEKLRKGLVNRGDIVLTTRGTVGQFSFYDESITYEPIRINSGMVTLSFTNADIKNDFFYALSKSSIIKKQIDLAAFGSAQPQLTVKIIKSLKLPVPPLPEQRKIAKILSTWDKAISTTERLIDNSKQQKKALMQQLLTGKKRLLDDSGKPFEGEWEEVKLDDIARYHKGYTYKSSEYSEESTLYGFLTLKSFLRGGGYSSKGIKYLLSPVDEKFSVIEGDLIFAVTDLTRNAEVVGAPVLVPNLEFEKSYISMDIVKLDVDKCVDKTFLFYLLKIRRNRNFMRARASGSTVLHLDVKGSKKLKLRLPKLKSEQCRIATVLINADKEIELLEQQLTDLKQEKKAMMQQLLTGKRRVKVDKKEVA